MGLRGYEITLSESEMCSDLRGSE